MIIKRTLKNSHIRFHTVCVYTLVFGIAAFPAVAEPIDFEEAIERALETAPTIEARSLQVEAAESKLLPANQLPDPKLSIDLLDQRVAGPFEPSLRPGRDGFPRGRIGVSQEFPNAAKRRARVNQARSDIGIARAAKSAEIQDIGLYSALAWVDVYYVKQRLDILTLLQKSLDDLSATSAARLTSGATRPSQAFEPERLKARLADRRSLLQAELEKAQAVLSRWTGLENPQISGRPPLISLEASELRSGIDALPILEVEQARIQRAESDIDLARANKRPDFGVNASFTQRRPEYGSYVSLGVTIDLPLFSKKRQDPLINARILEANAARLEAQDVERQLIAQLSGDLAGNRALRENWDRSKDILVPLTKTQAELERVSYGAGRVDLGTALNAVIALAEAEIDLLDREASLVRDTIRIKFTYDRNMP